MRFAYADPPYIGQAARHYGCTEINHTMLVAHLVADFPDGWVLSASVPSLRELLPLVPEDCRIGAWVKPFASFKPGVNPAFCWEPVLWRGGRKRGRDEPTVRDFVVANITLRRGTHGAKPDEFCRWVFDLLGMQPDDELVDLFPGSGAVSRAWEHYQMPLTTAR